MGSNPGYLLKPFLLYYFYAEIGEGELSESSGSKNDNFCLFWAYFYVEYVLTYGGGDVRKCQKMWLRNIWMVP